MVKITDTLSFCLIPSVLSCAAQRNWILSLKLSTSGWSFSRSPNCSCDYRRIDTWFCPEPVLPAGTGEDVWSVQLWHWRAPERQQLHSREKRSPLAWPGGSALSLLCYRGGDICAVWMANAFLIICSWPNLNFHQPWWTALEELSSRKWNLPRDRKCHGGCCHSLTASHRAGDKAVDGLTASPSTPLPFGCCAAARGSNLMTLHIVLEGPGERPRPFSDLNNTRTLCPPLCPGSGAYIHVGDQQHFTVQCVVVFF